MAALLFILSALFLIAVCVLIYKYESIEKALFAQDETSHVSVGRLELNVCIILGILMSFAAMVGVILFSFSDFSWSFSTLWGTICIILSYVALAVACFGVYKACMAESGVGRAALRSLFVLAVCFIGMLGGLCASFLTLIALGIHFIIAFASKSSPNAYASYPNAAAPYGQQAEQPVAPAPQPFVGENNVAPAAPVVENADSGKKAQGNVQEDAAPQTPSGEESVAPPAPLPNTQEKVCENPAPPAQTPTPPPTSPNNGWADGGFGQARRVL